MDDLSPEILPVMPIVFVAWADGVLTRAEADAIASYASQLGATPEAIAPWIDPRQPPSTAKLARLGRRLRAAARGLPTGAGLAEIGLALAAQTPAEGGEHATATALQALARQLHLDTPDAVADLIAPPSVPQFGPREPATLDPTPWTAWINQPCPEDRDALLALLCTPPFERESASSVDEARAQVLDWLQRVAAAGFGRRGFPTTDPAGDLTRLIATLETLALFELSLAVKAGVQFGMFGGSLYFLGNPAQQARYLDDAMTVALPGCYAMTERGHGSNVRDLQTTLTFDPADDTLIVHTPHERARKDWIGNAARDGRMATVFGQLQVGEDGHGVHAVLVPIRDAAGALCPGVRVLDSGPKMGLNGVDNGQLWFDQVRVPRENLLDRYGGIDAQGAYQSPIATPSARFFSMLGTLVGGRVTLTGAAIAVTKSALTIAVRYGARRRQFGPKDDAQARLLDYPAHQRRLIPRLAKTYALIAAQQALTQRYVAMGDEDSRLLEALAAGMKAVATWHATDTVQACREACGAQGYAAANRFAALKADSDIFTTFEGDNVVLMQLVARACLTDYQRRFDDRRLFGVVRHLMGRAALATFDRNPFIKRWKDVHHLRDGQYHLETLMAREADLLSSVSRRLRKRIARGAPAHQAFNELQNHLLSLANARVEHHVLRAFQDQLLTLTGDHRHVMELLADLYGLHCIESDCAWFLENNYLDGRKARAVRDQVDALCLEIRPHLISLVDAFAIPDAILGAPIAITP